jgi:hypothetical protein
MKLGLIALATVAVLSLAGCASNQGMQSQVDELTKRAHQQDAQIAHLEARAAKLKDQSVTTSQSAWEWTSQHAQEAWNSEMSQDARARLQKCWDDLKTSGK